MQLYIKLLTLSIITFFLLGSCNKFIEADLDKSLIGKEDIFSNDVTATAATTAIYNTMSSISSFVGRDRGLGTLSGISAGELNNYNEEPNFIQFQVHQLTETNDLIQRLWDDLYNLIYQANAVIEGIQKSKTLLPATASQLQGEARFVRALIYFYLTNLYGEVPLISTTDYRENSLISRTALLSINAKIEEDLLAAQTLMVDGYVINENARPNKATVSALLARFYLYQQDYEKADMEASSVIDNGPYLLNTDLDQTFLVNSSETIWQIASVDPYVSTYEGYYFIITGFPQFNVLSPDFANSFEVNDQRAVHWVGSYFEPSLNETFYFPYKYKLQYPSPGEPKTEYSIVFRLPELYLIRAEARAQQGNITGAQEDINEVRNRSGMGDTGASDMPSLLLAIEQERKSEYFTEYGHRWLDLKRTGRAITVLGSGITQSDLLYPLPRAEFDKNPNLGSQNTGY